MEYSIRAHTPQTALVRVLRPSRTYFLGRRSWAARDVRQGHRWHLRRGVSGVGEGVDGYQWYYTVFPTFFGPLEILADLGLV